MAFILTLTPNPAIDVSTSAARVASRLGATAVAIYPSGGFAGQELQRLVRGEGVESLVVPVNGETRQDFTVLDETTWQEYRFVLPGPHLSDREWMACLKALAGFERKPDFICASGSLPPGAPADFYARVAEIADLRGARFALDASGPALAAALRERVHLVKPNLAELREIVGGALDEERSLVDACRDLIAGGRTQVVALTLGADGALLVTEDEAWRARPLDIRPVSTVGAGDSFLGAMVWALADGKPVPEAFRYGCAAGAAALLQHGTALCRADDVRRLLTDVGIERVTEGRAVA